MLATVEVGASNVIRVGEAQSRASLQQGVRQACAAAGVDPQSLTRTCMGAAGSGRPETSEILRRILNEMVSGEVIIVADSVTALQAAFQDSIGTVVIAGTGSIAYARNAQRQTARAGGWGFSISDEGSGQWIGRAAVSAMMRAQDEQEDTRLLRDILAAWHLASIDDVIKTANAIPAPDYSALFPVVLAAGDAGDGIARSVLAQAGAELANLAKIVIRRVFENAETIPLAMSGSVFRHSALIRQVFYNSVRSEYAGTRLATTVVEPVKGALELARKGTGAA
jgi:N-acetylglucosamine kinase-like BadF-type ATPase